MKKEPGKAPEGFLYFLWLLKNWKIYWRELTGLALIIVLFQLLLLLAPPVCNAIRSHFSSVTLKVIHFDYSTGKTTIEFNNKKRHPVSVEHIYVTVAPTNSAPEKSIPQNLQRFVTIFDKNTIVIPGGAGLEFGPLSNKVSQVGRLIRMATVLVHDSPSLVLPPGITTTNVAPNSTSFTDVCNRFAPGAKLEVLLHTSLTDEKGRSRVQEIHLGNYIVGDNYTALDDIPRPKDIDILRNGKISGSTGKRMIYTFSGRMKFPSLDDNIHSLLIENGSSNELLVTTSENIEGLIPIILIKKSITYGCLFRVELQEGETLPQDFAAWVLSCDEGKTVMNVPMAFSNKWSETLPSPLPKKEYIIPLPSNNWCLLINGERWAKVSEGAVKCEVTEKMWFKLLDPDDATSSSLLSDYNRIALQELDDDTSWIPITDIPTNSKPRLIIQNEIEPDISILSSLRLPDDPINIPNPESVPNSEASESAP